MSGSVFAVVTGASRGFGKSVAEELVRKLAPQHAVDIILIARSESGLTGTARAVEEITRGLASARRVTVRQEVMDLGNMGSLEQRLGDIFASVGTSLVRQGPWAGCDTVCFGRCLPIMCFTQKQGTCFRRGPSSRERTSSVVR